MKTGANNETLVKAAFAQVYRKGEQRGEVVWITVK